jgi:branched-chain amino acid transport system ATP-binding protein
MAAMLNLQHLVRTFGGLTAVNEVSLRGGAGERRALIGPNGAGKTTLFNLIGGMLPVTSGAIWFDGRNITRLPAHERANLGMGRTFQRNNLFFNLSVFENVRLAVQHQQRISRKMFTAAARFPGASEASAKLLEQIGLADRAFEPARALAYGQQRVLEIGLALAMRPRILLLDEPTAGMSPAETTAIARMIAGLPRALTLLIIEHDMDVVFSIADTITVLHYGQVLAEGAPEEISRSRQVQEIYLGQVADSSLERR